MNESLTELQDDIQRLSQQQSQMQQMHNIMQNGGQTQVSPSQGRIPGRATGPCPPPPPRRSNCYVTASGLVGLVSYNRLSPPPLQGGRLDPPLAPLLLRLTAAELTLLLMGAAQRMVAKFSELWGGGRRISRNDLFGQQ